MSGAVLVLRLALGAILLATGLAKLLDVPGFSTIVAAYRVLPDAFVLPAATALTVAELGLSAWLFAGVRLRLAACGAVLLHAVYLGWTVMALSRGLVLLNCGCFGVFWARPLGVSTAVEDAVLLLASLALLARVAGRPRTINPLAFALACVLATGAAAAAELDGVTMPDIVRVAGTALHLNGIGVRSYSVFRVHVYVAGLYLTQPSRDASAILASPDSKLIQIRYLHDVNKDDVRRAWRYSFEQNCAAPCRIPESELERFLAASPAIRSGDAGSYVFTAGGVEMRANESSLGRFADPAFARLLLATFIGAEPPTEQLKRALLGETK